jgi:sensory rhodopsin
MEATFVLTLSGVVRMIELTYIFGLGAGGMALGSIAFISEWISSTDRSKYYATLTSISLTAMIAYTSMSLGYGIIEVDARAVFAPRYIDWIITTPLLLLFIGMIAGSDKRELATTVFVNTVVMVAGFDAALISGPGKFVAFGFASVAYIALIYLLTVSMTKTAEDRPERVSSLFRSLRNLTVILWSIYPIIWLLSSAGFSVITVPVNVMLVTYLDILTKVGFGLIAINTSSAIGSTSSEGAIATDPS